MSNHNWITLAAALALFAPAAASPQDQARRSARAEAKARTIEVAVSSDGFVPAEIHVKKGEKVNLVVTRTTERTCATAIVIKDLGVSQELPLHKPVTVAVKAEKKGSLRYACPMDMIAGKIVVD